VQANANLERAQKSKNQLQTTLENKHEKPFLRKLPRAKANVKGAQDTLKDAEKNYQRFEELFGKGVVTEKERDTMKLQHDIAHRGLLKANQC